MCLECRAWYQLRTANRLILQVSLLPLCAQAAPHIGRQRCLGGGGDELARSFRQTSDGGYASAGDALSEGSDSLGGQSSDDTGFAQF
jgi:hypothetical protein